jgi:CMP-N-acetylneuraminic acid synthetase
MKNFLNKKILNKRSQDLKNYYRLNGAIYICKINCFLKEKSFFLKNNIYAFEMLKEESVDIDTEFDFKIVKALLK